MFIPLIVAAIVKLFPAVYVCAAPCTVRIIAQDARAIFIEGAEDTSHDCSAVSGRVCEFKFTFGPGESRIYARGKDGKLSNTWKLLVN